MQYRKHWLVNALGETYDLTNPLTTVFFNEPQGFGFEREFSSIQVGNSELVTSQSFVLTDINGELVFYSEDNSRVYEMYQQFIQFAKYKPLEFHYQTPNLLKSYYCDVLFTLADKTEIGQDGMMRVPVTFHRLTEWLDDEDYSITLYNVLTNDGKHYNLQRDYHYAGTGLSNTVINNNGTDDVGFIITVNGSVQNPQFTLSQYGQVYGVCKITGTYDFVQLNSVERNESIYLELNGSAISNPEQYQDFTVRNGSAYLTWCKFKTGQTTFTFTSGNIATFAGSVTISFKNSYVSV